MFLLVPAHPGCPGQNPQSRKTVVYVCVFTILQLSVLSVCICLNNCMNKVGTCESAVCVRIEFRIESGVKIRIRIESRIESAVGPTIAISILSYSILLLMQRKYVTRRICEKIDNINDVTCGIM